MFVFVAILLKRGYRVEREGLLDGRFENYRGWYQVPRPDWDDVGGEEIDILDVVGFLDEIVAAELAEVSGAIAGDARFDLDTEETATLFDANVIAERFSLGFDHVIAVLGGGGHEEEFDPFAAFFEIPEFLPVVFLTYFFYASRTPRFGPKFH